ncbi:MAG TPA: NAD-binding protein [bacterium]|nr:NAD-binding protein [bacterium]HPN34410.1 NAD-binding protein [bacterium]
MNRSLSKKILSYWRDRWKPVWDLVEWPLLILLAVLTILFGVIGFAAHFHSRQQPRSFLDCLYLTLQLFTLESGSLPGDKSWMLEIARFSAPLLAVYTALKALGLLFSRQIMLIRLAFTQNHTILCGLGRKGYRLAREYWSRGERVVVLEQDPNTPFVLPARAAGIPVLVGNAADAKLLNQARLSRAERLICVCGEDGINAEIALAAQSVLGNQPRPPLHCFVHIVEPAVWDLLNGFKFTFDTRSVRMDFFNIYDWGAKRMLEKYPLSAAATSTQSPPRLLIVGLGKLGGSLLVQIARAWFWKTRDVKKAGKLSITIIDKAATAKIRQLVHRYPQLEQACRLFPIEEDIRWLCKAKAGKRRIAKSAFLVHRAYVCVDNDALALHAAGVLQNVLPDRKTPIVVRMAVRSGLAALLSMRQSVHADSIEIFHLLDEACRTEAMEDYIDVLAKAMHEAYVERCLADGTGNKDRPALQPWARLSEDYRNANRAQAHHLPCKLAKVGYRLEPLYDWQADRQKFPAQDLEDLARMEHDRWLEERRQAGWKLGPDDPAQRTNPHIKPWDELEEKIKEIDRNTVASIPRYLARIDLQMVRYESQARTTMGGLK